MQNLLIYTKQGWIHGNPVTDSWAGAVMQKPLGIQKCDSWTDRPTNTARWSCVSATKKGFKVSCDGQTNKIGGPIDQRIIRWLLESCKMRQKIHRVDNMHCHNQQSLSTNLSILKSRFLTCIIF